MQGSGTGGGGADGKGGMMTKPCSGIVRETMGTSEGVEVRRSLGEAVGTSTTTNPSVGAIEGATAGCCSGSGGCMDTQKEDVRVALPLSSRIQHEAVSKQTGRGKACKSGARACFVTQARSAPLEPRCQFAKSVNAT